MSQDDLHATQNQITIPIIGYHRSALSQKFGIPRQPNLVALPSVIEMIAPYDTPEAFSGIEEFSHLWISWYTHHNHLTLGSKSQSHETISEDTADNVFKPDCKPVFKPKVRPPRLGGNTKLGVFATRTTYRPSQLGLSVVELVRVEVMTGSVRLHIRGADMVDGTPIVDIKPYIGYSDALSEAICGFAPDKPPLKQVVCEAQAAADFEKYCDQSDSDLNIEDKHIIQQLIAQDPRPAYRQRDTQRTYYMSYKHYDIGFLMQYEFEDNTTQPKLCIVSIQPHL
ncbi:tRNA (N6-threonylcarbamoyladenosine(37)-N6)-methyltransferase TrmO [Psychrobacter sp.]|uniref:SAM-dependent methyltransferase n=1 Tax=Psychrobacter sp. TaxID=56811 RepID=UPI0025EB1A55|nr:tRNA (N6-threonylcarbamoyladenosine(37)-N6)-methyltransferase TrmO [Psychrobacter sp.]